MSIRTNAAGGTNKETQCCAHRGPAGGVVAAKHTPLQPSSPATPNNSSKIDAVSLIGMENRRQKSNLRRNFNIGSCAAGNSTYDSAFTV
jgi:hypothetical protein